MWNAFGDHSMGVRALPKMQGYYLFLSSLQTISGLELVENWESVMYKKRILLTN